MTLGEAIRAAGLDGKIRRRGCEAVRVRSLEFFRIPPELLSSDDWEPVPPPLALREAIRQVIRNGCGLVRRRRWSPDAPAVDPLVVSFYSEDVLATDWIVVTPEAPR